MAAPTDWYRGIRIRFRRYVEYYREAGNYIKLAQIVVCGQQGSIYIACGDKEKSNHQDSEDG